MPAASSRWRRAPTTRRCTGSSRRSAASSRSMRFHVPARLARTVRTRRFTVAVRPRFRCRDRRLRGAGAETRAHLDQRTASASSIASCSSVGHCHTVEVYDGDAAGRRALRRQPRRARSSARACSTARAMPRRSRWCIWSRGCRPAASRCSTRSSSPITCKTFGAIESAARSAITGCSTQRWSAKADFAGARRRD